ncbi:MAG: hypothetical protein KG003_12030 [Bacteroidetes bacterium]|nr:hypothetical protein [Bacteroidota bacterium]
MANSPKQILKFTPMNKLRVILQTKRGAFRRIITLIGKIRNLRRDLIRGFTLIGIGKNPTKVTLDVSEKENLRMKIAALQSDLYYAKNDYKLNKARHKQFCVNNKQYLRQGLAARRNEKMVTAIRKKGGLRKKSKQS